MQWMGVILYKSAVYRCKHEKELEEGLFGLEIQQQLSAIPVSYFFQARFEHIFKNNYLEESECCTLSGVVLNVFLTKRQQHMEFFCTDRVRLHISH